ncbi:MAG: methyltransferase domain-containing protein [Ruminococcaceae bacterium]|nr:methyltransferase domain-containing protein [Oscillospiraceae bacterium]
MNQRILSLLKCPVCEAGMSSDADGRTLRCLGTRTHCYDVSRSGYLNFTSPRDGVGDGRAAVRARTLFLDAGYYEPLSDAVNSLLDKLGAKTVIDAGCGEGYYTNRMGTGRCVIGVDLSRDGIDSAARCAKRLCNDASFFVGSLFKLPVLGESIDAVTNLFAPCAEEEFLRVLRPGGNLLLVGAGERHLFGLKEVLYENPYLNPGRADLPTQMELVETSRLTYTVTVTGRETIDALFSMTPYYWRTSERDRVKLSSLEELTTELDFNLYVFKKGH